MEQNEIPTKDYKYKVELANDIIDVRRIYGDTARQNWQVIRNKKNGIFKPTLNVRERDLKITKKTASEYGEFIATKIGEKIDFATCRVELVKRKMLCKYPKSKRIKEIPGCISYTDLAVGESLVQAINVLAWYKSEHTEEYLKIVDPTGYNNNEDKSVFMYTENFNNNIEVVMPAFEAYIREQCAGTQEQVDEIRQKLIEMVVFDCNFANTDRNDENYGISINKDGNFRFYPVFDNEYILGFSEAEEDIKSYTPAKLQEHISKDLTSRMGITSKSSKISPSAMMTYLFTTYPQETIKAYNKMSKYEESDLIDIMNECEGLSELHKAYALKIFRLRKKEINLIKDEYIDEHGNLRNQNILTKNMDKEPKTRQAPSLDD